MATQITDFASFKSLDGSKRFQRYDTGMTILAARPSLSQRVIIFTMHNVDWLSRGNTCGIETYLDCH
jgi:hypothetical protein